MTPEERERFPATVVTLKNGIAVVIRPLSAADGKGLGDFFEKIPREDTRFFYPYPLDRNQAAVLAAQADGALSVVLVAERAEGALAGYAYYRWQNQQAERSLFGICVLPEHQAQGVGRVLFVRLLEIARSVGPSVMGLTVQKANERALALYRNMGFQVIREQMKEAARGFPAEPELYMELRVR